MTDNPQEVTDTSICSDEILTIRANFLGEDYAYNHYKYIWNTGDTTLTLTIDSTHYGIGVHEFSVIVINKNTDLQCESYDTVIVEIKSCTGINEVIQNNGNLIYPNPANNTLIINNQQLTVAHITIIDLTGKILLNKDTDTGNLTQAIDLSDLENGMYLIKIESNTNLLITKRFIIRH